MKKLLKWFWGIFAALAAMVIITMMICIHQYGKGKVNLRQVIEVNLVYDTVELEKNDQGSLFLTDHDWVGDELLDLGCRETDRMGTRGFYTAPDGTEFSIEDMKEWCFFFRLHKIKGITLDKLGLHM